MRGDRVLGFFATVGDGFSEASKTLVPSTFLVKEVTGEERVHTIQQVSWR